MLVAQKITRQTAHHMNLLACSSAQMNVRNLEFITRQEQERQEQAERLAMEVIIREKQMPFRQIPEVEEWLQHYDDIKDRYKFLVLDGPSQMGKTRFAASLTSVEKFYYLDCSSCIMPDMRSFNRRHHDVVLFDEIKATTVVSVKKLFQSSIDVVSLGSSQTNMNLYRIWCHRTKMICASNRWKAELSSLDAPDREWLEKKTQCTFLLIGLCGRRRAWGRIGEHFLVFPSLHSGRREGPDIGDTNQGRAFRVRLCQLHGIRKI